MLLPNKMCSKAWNHEETDKLRSLYTKGVSVIDIAEELGRSYGSVKGKLQRMGLHRPKYERAEGGVHPLTPAEYSLGYDEVFKLWSGVLKRFQEGPLTRDNIKFLSVATKSLAGYIRACEQFAAPPGSEEEAELDQAVGFEEDETEFLHKIHELQHKLSGIERMTRRRRRSPVRLKP